jgi:hypothetical protein
VNIEEDEEGQVDKAILLVTEMLGDENDKAP